MEKISSLDTKNPDLVLYVNMLMILSEFTVKNVFRKILDKNEAL